MKLLFPLLALVMAMLPQCVDAATLSWTYPTQFTNGQQIPADAVFQSHVYCAPETGEFALLTTTPNNTVSLDPCAPVSRWYVKVQLGTHISGPSETVYFTLANDSTGEPFPPVMTSAPAPVCTACPVCETVPPEPVIIWKVQPWRDATTRPVYSAQRMLAGERVEIGRVEVGTVCGEFIMQYSATVTALEWRRVTATNQEDGAAVCERAR